MGDNDIAYASSIGEKKTRNKPCDWAEVEKIGYGMCMWVYLPGYYGAKRL